LKRLIIYCPGYDLRPPRQTVQLVFSEFEKFLKIRKLNGQLSDLREGVGPDGSGASWSGHVDWPEGRVDARFVQLGWRDVMKPDFARSWLRTLKDAVRSTQLYARAGGYAATLKSNWGHGLFCLYPVVGLAVYLLAAVLPPVFLAPAILDMASAAVPGRFSQIVSWGVLLCAAALWLAAVRAFVRWLEPRSHILYLVNSWHFMARLAMSDHAEMRARIEAFADHIVTLEAQVDIDEDVVFISHSCGTFVAVLVLAAVLRRNPDIVRRSGGFAFVTLGPAFDCLGGFGKKSGFGRAVGDVARSGVDWTDLYAPQDFLCGGRTTPVTRYAWPVLAGESLPEPRRFSVRVPDRLSPAAYRHLRFRYFKLHFCYFLTTERPGLFDVYRLALGPKRASDQLEAWKARAED
jgi:hypothetical protein